MIWTK